MIVSILLFLILFYTHWLPQLEEEFHFSHQKMTLFFVGMLVSYWIPPIPIRTGFMVHMGSVMMLLVCLSFFFRISQKLYFLSVLFSSSSIAFSFHEAFHIHADWTLVSFRLWMFLLFVVGSFIAFKELADRITYLWGGCFLTHLLILWVHREMLNPILVGEQAFMDFCWLAVFLLVLFQYQIKPFSSYFRNS